MSKSIDTLVEDIYALFDEELEVDISDTAIEAFGAAVAQRMRDALTQQKRGSRPNDRLAPTELGETCHRKIWYSRQDIEDLDGPKEDLLPQTRIKFLYGDILEEMILLLARTAGHEVTMEQHTIQHQYGPVLVRGRLDAIIDGVLVDVKSSSKFGFKKFEEGLDESNDTFGYRAQLEAYQSDPSVDCEEAGWLVINKETGALLYSPNRTGKEDARKHTVDRAATLGAAAQGSDEPGFDTQFSPVPHGKKNHKLCTKCSYCAYKEICWRGANQGEGLKGYAYSSGPVWLTEVREEPRVPMITSKEK